MNEIILLDEKAAAEVAKVVGGGSSSAYRHMISAGGYFGSSDIVFLCLTLDNDTADAYNAETLVAYLKANPDLAIYGQTRGIDSLDEPYNSVYKIRYNNEEDAVYSYTWSSDDGEFDTTGTDIDLSERFSDVVIPLN